jgi:chromosomal replication initiation ATPase DnaA
VTGVLHAYVEDAAREAGCSLAALLGERRSPRLAQARQRAMARAYYDTGFSAEQIARAFNRERSTVSYAVRKFRPEGARG